MRKFRSTLAIGLLATPLVAADCCKNAVAVVASLSGSATKQTPGSREKAAVSTLDWLAPGTTLEVGARSQAVLILSNGHRYELGQGAKVTVTADADPKITGSGRELPALPPIPEPGPIALESAPTAGAVPVRGGEDMKDHLYPRAGMAALTDKTILRFRAVPGATSYHVGLEDEAGKSLFNVTTESTEVPLPDGTLEPGTQYYWRVRAMKSGQAIGAGLAQFATLPAEVALHRAEFAEALGNDPATLAVAAEVDQRLGLIAEACAEFSAALRHSPNDTALTRALAACESSRDGK
jgi:hypothetical protein